MNKPVKCSKLGKHTRPQSFLQVLSYKVTWCLNYSIQKARVPSDLQMSQETYFLNHEIALMQARLKKSILNDYAVQRGKILTERKRFIDFK